MPRGSKPGERRGGRQRGTPNKATIAKTAALNAASADPAITPLQFLLDVMRDPTSPTDLRIQVARAAAPLVHGKLGTASAGIPARHTAAIGSPGFAIDLTEAKALRDIQRRLGALLRKRYSRKRDTLTVAELAEQSELLTLLGKQSAAIVCPPGYGPQEVSEDSNQLHQLHCKRLSPPSCGGGDLKGAEDDEEAFLMARVSAFRHSKEGRDRQRILELGVFRPCRTSDEQAELDRLGIVYPRGPEGPLGQAIQLRLAELRQKAG